jgi:mRNA-degrading endonuclease RelE of RelBE toxin-antitoxin system
MPGYTITFARSARKELQSLPTDVAERLLKRVESLITNARPTGSKKLSGSKHLWPLRVGDYRVVEFIELIGSNKRNEISRPVL